jgi:hypothetical protein
MKDITGEVRIEEYEIATLKSQPIRYAYKVLVNVYSNSIDTLQDYKRMVIVYDGELDRVQLMGYNLGKEEYFVGVRTTKKPNNVKVYRY